MNLPLQELAKFDFSFLLSAALADMREKVFDRQIAEAEAALAELKLKKQLLRVKRESLAL